MLQELLQLPCRLLPVARTGKAWSCPCFLTTELAINLSVIALSRAELLLASSQQCNTEGMLLQEYLRALPSLALACVHRTLAGLPVPFLCVGLGCDNSQMRKQ